MLARKPLVLCKPQEGTQDLLEIQVDIRRQQCNDVQILREFFGVMEIQNVIDIPDTY